MYTVHGEHTGVLSEEGHLGENCSGLDITYMYNLSIDSVQFLILDISKFQSIQKCQQYISDINALPQFAPSNQVGDHSGMEALYARFTMIFTMIFR